VTFAWTFVAVRKPEITAAVGFEASPGRDPARVAQGCANDSRIPSWHHVPAEGGVAPPVRTRAQLLPLGALSWENFERLCLRLAQRESDVEHCQLYGLRGQAQQGIDLYGRLRRGRKRPTVRGASARLDGNAPAEGEPPPLGHASWPTTGAPWAELCPAGSLRPTRTARPGWSA
jgi:hypothetical protein